MTSSTSAAMIGAVISLQPAGERKPRTDRLSRLSDLVARDVQVPAALPPQSRGTSAGLPRADQREGAPWRSSDPDAKRSPPGSPRCCDANAVLLGSPHPA